MQNIVWNSRSSPEANSFQARWKPVISFRMDWPDVRNGLCCGGCPHLKAVDGRATPDETREFFEAAPRLASLKSRQ